MLKLRWSLGNLQFQYRFIHENKLLWVFEIILYQQSGTIRKVIKLLSEIAWLMTLNTFNNSISTP